ncbi:peptidoglycan DD-metalloendopeptidase family protein [Eilatimonas milleporae]|uniref:peptidoglycan DD-metalloendopeptidase family protein n=1 Tax=Eilatimonas milleporae TaxID=911205 RepID=UPI001472D712|nr:peptidoglycan DD-metalloendopeptidase family protein [Eilatimonas milleporae]
MLRGISVIAKRVEDWRRRVFPERQLFLRSEGRVRFITITSYVQMGLASAGVALAIWGLTTSYVFLTRDSVLASKERALNALSADYDALNRDYTRLERDVEQRALKLQERQQFLESLIDANEPARRNHNRTVQAEAATENETVTATDRTSAPEMTTGSAETDQARPISYLNSATSHSMTVEPGHTDRREAIVALLRETDQRQRHVASLLHDSVSGELKRIDEAITATRLDTATLFDKWSGAAQAVGGPYMPEAGFPAIFDMEDGSLFQDLFDNWQRREAAGEILQSFPVTEPAADYYISSRFGRRRDPMRRTWTNHPGLDMAGWPGTAILAAAPGRVVHAGWYGPYGNMVELDHDNGFRTRYGHMKRVRVKVGDSVADGQRVGDMGRTGRTTGTHLHFEVWYDGQVRDPLPFLRAAEDVREIQRRYQSADG